MLHAAVCISSPGTDGKMCNNQDVFDRRCACTANLRCTPACTTHDSYVLGTREQMVNNGQQDFALCFVSFGKAPQEYVKGSHT